jgi:hypothetical protein
MIYKKLHIYIKKKKIKIKLIVFFFYTYFDKNGKSNIDLQLNKI